MRKFLWLLTALPSMAFAQQNCVNWDFTHGPFTCTNGASCGVYYTYTTSECNIEGLDCSLKLPVKVCCNTYDSYQHGDRCFMTEMSNPLFRSKMRELAKSSDILVPTCSGGYVPLQLALRKYDGIDDGSL